jgi:hypothetical protein
MKSAQHLAGILVVVNSVGTFAVASAAVADDSMPQTLAPGMRVRILAPDVFSGKVVGTITNVNDESVTVAAPDRGAPVSVSREKIARMDVSQGPRSRGTDALIGLGIGAIAGALVANNQTAGIVGRGTVDALVAAIGAGLGALIGVAIPPGEHWKPTTAFRARVSLAPRIDHGVGLTVAVGF